MQFNISINQKAFTEIAPDCDIIDAAIFDFIHNFIGSGQTDRIEDNGDWYWVSYQKIIDENPILGISTKAPIYKRIEKLIDADVLKRYPKNQELAKTYFGRGKNYSAILYNKPHSQRNDPTSEKNDPSVSKDRPPTSEKIDNHSTSNHSTNQEKRARVNGCPIPEPLQDEEIKKKYEFYCQYMKENFNRHPTSSTTQIDLQKLLELKNKGNDPIKVIDQTIQGRNKSFYEIRNFDKEEKKKSPFRPNAVHIN